MPHQTVGATTTGNSLAACSAPARHTPSVRIVSTPTGRCGPCCSIEATGRITIASAAALARSSSAVSSFHITEAGIWSLLRLDQAFDEQPLHGDDDSYGRQHGQHGGGHHQLPFGERIRGDDHLPDADHDRLHVVA